MAFRDRTHAGSLLAGELERYRAVRPVVLGLARGGVPVALEVARALHADLDLIVVRKLGAPSSPEYALGAIAEGGAVFIRREALAEAGLDDEAVAVLAEHEAEELARRVRVYRGGRALPDLTGRTVIVVDDGVATGATARAAARAARVHGARRVVVAAPVIAASARPELLQDCDEVVAVEFPSLFHAVGIWYENFAQVDDEEVLSCLRVQCRPESEPVSIPVHGSGPGAHAVEADLVVPRGARGLVIFAHGSGSNRRSPRNLLVAGALHRARIATLLLDLLTPDEATDGAGAERLGADIQLMASRVEAAARWAAAEPRTRDLGVGLFGSSTGAAAVLAAAADRPHPVAAVVSRSGRPDLVPEPILCRVHAPVLLVVGGRDEEVLRANRAALRHLPSARLAVVPGAGHLFEEPGALEQLARLAAGWFSGRLAEHIPGASWTSP